MTNIIKSLNEDGIDVAIQDMLEAEETIMITHDSGGCMQVTMMGYHDPLLAVSDLIGAQSYMMDTMVRPWEPPDRQARPLPLPPR